MSDRLNSTLALYSDPILGVISGSRPVSRVLSWAIIHLGPLSPMASSDLPGDSADHAIVPLFGLAPGGVYLATVCYHLRGALLPHPFTLTRPTWLTRRSALCCTFRRLSPPRGYLAPCPVEPGLSSPHVNARSDCLADSQCILGAIRVLIKSTERIDFLS